jgi:hypothetical protein
MQNLQHGRRAVCSNFNSKTLSLWSQGAREPVATVQSSAVDLMSFNVQEVRDPEYFIAVIDAIYRNALSWKGLILS